MERIEKHPITRHEIVLIAVPLSNDNWVEVVDACIYTDARFIISGFEIDATSLATTIIQEGVTIVATTSQVWLQIYHELSTVPDFRVDQLRIILLDSLA
ncbi:MAG: hypothetical protein GWN59_03515 [Calditrichae bacterium]|nr:hypothetical protein [Calditrichia bacterium]NIV72012.1 hypothetical protein [Calditrichia bacterium]